MTCEHLSILPQYEIRLFLDRGDVFIQRMADRLETARDIARILLNEHPTAPFASIYDLMREKEYVETIRRS